MRCGTSSYHSRGAPTALGSLGETGIVRLVLQRVSAAEVRVGDEVVGAIGAGALVLVGVERGDGEEEAVRAIDKLTALRWFSDAEGRMNLDAAAVGGEFLIVSQFTLAASLDRGRRPSFDRAAPPELAEPLVEAVARGLEARGFRVARGRFGAAMRVSLVNDGPVTFVLDLGSRGRGVSGLPAPG